MKKRLTRFGVALALAAFMSAGVVLAGPPENPPDEGNGPNDPAGLCTLLEEIRIS